MCFLVKSILIYPFLLCPKCICHNRYIYINASNNTGSTHTWTRNILSHDIVNGCRYTICFVIYHKHFAIIVIVKVANVSGELLNVVGQRACHKTKIPICFGGFLWDSPFFWSSIFLSHFHVDFWCPHMLCQAWWHVFHLNKTLFVIVLSSSIFTTHGPWWSSNQLHYNCNDRPCQCLTTCFSWTTTSRITHKQLIGYNGIARDTLVNEMSILCDIHPFFKSIVVFKTHMPQGVCVLELVISMIAHVMMKIIRNN